MDIDAHLGRLPTLYLASIITRCLAAIQANDAVQADEEGALEEDPTAEAKPLAWLIRVRLRPPFVLSRTEE
jgi:hypothetical protein